MDDPPGERPPIVLDYADTPARDESAARTAFDAGLLLYVPILPGIVAINAARRALTHPGRTAEDVKLAVAGLVLGIVNVVLFGGAFLYWVFLRKT